MRPEFYPMAFLALVGAQVVIYYRWVLSDPEIGRRGTITHRLQVWDARFPVTSFIVAAVFVGIWVHVFKQGVTIP
jgi:hypothetical protein